MTTTTAPPPQSLPPTLPSPSLPVFSPELWEEIDRTVASGAKIGKLPQNISASYGPGTLSSVQRYIPAQYGVYVLTNAASQLLVVKPQVDPTAEFFGAQIAEAIGLPNPDTDVVAIGSPAGTTLLKLLAKNKEFQENSERTGMPKFLTVMTFVEGGFDLAETSSEHEKTAENAKKRVLPLLGEPQQATEILRQIAHIAALDIFLFYEDRTGVIGLGNLANVMLIARGNQIVSTVAIDQAVRVTTKKRLRDGVVPLLATVKTITAIASGDKGYAIRLWEGLPDYFRIVVNKSLGKGTGPKLTAQFLLEGLQNISNRLDLKRLGSMLQRMVSAGLNVDSLDLDALEVALATLQKALPKNY